MLCVLPAGEAHALVNWAAMAIVAAASASARTESQTSGEPLPWGSKPVSTHAPCAVHDCTPCHARQYPFDPGPLGDKGDALCLSCHEDIGRHAHAFREGATCRDAHDSTQPNLLAVRADDWRSCHVDHAR